MIGFGPESKVRQNEPLDLQQLHKAESESALKEKDQLLKIVEAQDLMRYGMIPGWYLCTYLTVEPGTKSWSFS